MAPVSLEQILFFLFIRLLDRDGLLTLKDIEKLDRLLAKPSLIEAACLEPALANLDKQYSALWQHYQNTHWAKEDAQLPELLSQYYECANQDAVKIAWSELRIGLANYLQYFCLETGLTAKLHGKKARQERLKAAKEFISMLNVWTPAQQGGQMGDISSKDAEQAVNRFQEKLYQAMTGGVGSDKLKQFGKGVHRLLCTHVYEHNERVKTFTFVGPEVGCWSFEPGQFFTFEVPCAQGVVRRSYSISSSPHQPYAIDVTVKRVDEGVGSVWMHEHMQPGREIVAHGPHGQFSILPSLHKPKIAFFAAGVGITPLMSMMQCLSQGKHELDAVLLNRVHSYEDVIFSAELQSLKDIRQITISTNNEGQWPKALGLLQDPGARQITPTLIESLIPDIQERTVYLCGPHSFKDSVLACLEFLNFDKTQFFSESFGGIHQPGKHLLNSDGASALGGILEGYLKLLADDIPTEELCEVAFSRSGKTARCAMGDNLLEVAQFNGVSISSSCKTGACGTCKCTLLEGSVEMNDPTGLSESDRAAGQILACVAYANNRKIVLDV